MAREIRGSTQIMDDSVPPVKISDQGHGGTLDSDMVDGKHASELLAGAAGVGCIRADGSVPLVADWNVNGYQIKWFLFHKGAVFPTTPSPVEGQPFYRTDESNLYIRNGAGWNHAGKGVTAADVVNVPAGGIAATDVQAALDELDTEKAPTHNLLDGTWHPDTATQAVTRGSIIVGIGATPKWDELTIGAAGRYLRSDGTDLAYAQIPASEVVNTPAGGIAATDVQAALNELDTEKAGIADIETISADWTWGTDKKILFRDAAIYIHSPTDGVLHIEADDSITFGADFKPDAVNDLDLGAPDAEIALLYMGDPGVIYFGLAQDVALGRVAADMLALGTGDGLRIPSTGQLQLRDTAIYIASLNDGFLDLVADTAIRLNQNTLVTAAIASLSLAVYNTTPSGQGDAILNLHRAADGNSAYIGYNIGASIQWQLGIGIAAIDANFRLRQATAGVVVILANFTGAVANTLVLDQGNVGIGTVLPVGKLHVLTGGTSGYAGANRGMVITSDAGPRVVFEDTSEGAGDRVMLLRYEVESLIVSSMIDNGTAFDVATIMAISRDGSVTIDSPTFHVDAAANRVGVGTITPGSQVHIYRDGYAELVVEAGADDAGYAYLQFKKKRGGNIVQNGDELGMFYAVAWDGVAWQNASGLQFIVDGVPGVNNTPARIEFYTTTTLGWVERMRITSTGRVGIGTGTPQSILHVLDNVAGNIGITFQNTNAGGNCQLRFFNAAGVEKSAVTYDNIGGGGGGLLFSSDGVTNTLILDSNKDVYPGGNKTQDFGLPGTAWDDAYADDWHNVADFYFMDERKNRKGKIVPVDDLAIICGMLPMGEFDPRTGLPLLDDNSLPPWIFTRDKEGKETLYDADGRPYLSMKMVNSLIWGAIRQLKGMYEGLEARIPV